ncbi:diaminopimelate decarboxylase [Streptomyces shenzhenensis]|uniref:Diaminopimelate decarboxylase n=1 Tax=Streptomyces shenzhenensis TaxID=943815 RepID=A0A3M0IDZ7_9ACTN|nr:diaminopimelate decarboxylase [Streptomyces shenzhenensis]RMB85023.1 diaminopimelate decarboxylase [Streptomyces shenzhenensis]
MSIDVHTSPLSGERGQAIAAAIRQRLVSADQPVVGLIDLNGLRRAAAELHAAFGFPDVEVRHTFAVKAAALVPVLRHLWHAGIGAEVASPGELAIARAAGISAGHTVLDSPAKTEAELREALELGIAVNADNPQELSRIDALVRRAPAVGPVGVRVNAQVGAGSIGAMSTATATSKFGIALRDEGAEEWLVEAFLKRPWLTRLHTHTGSQGIPLALMAEGVAAVHALAEKINAAAGRRQITVLDIGGGLPVNFSSDVMTPTFRDYAQTLRAVVPGLFDGRYGIVTEFGRSLAAKQGVVLARVEYTKSAGGRAIAVTHAGAQVATRTVFAPESWPLRVEAWDASGRPREGTAVPQDIAGPCCFAGDLVARERPLPLLEQGDLVALLDTGAYYFSTHFAYNSLPRPAVYGYTADETSVRFEILRRPQTLDELVAESGG